MGARVTRNGGPLAVGVLGAGGRMGRLVCRAVEEAPDLALVAGVGRNESRDPLRDASVLVDFTHPDAIMENIRWGVGHGRHLVVGTSGMHEERLRTVRRWLADAPDVAVVVVPNFSISAALAMSFAVRGRALRHGRDHRLQPRQQDRRAIRHRPPHRRADRPSPPRGRSRSIAVGGARSWVRCGRCLHPLSPPRGARLPPDGHLRPRQRGPHHPLRHEGPASLPAWGTHRHPSRVAVPRHDGRPRAADRPRPATADSRRGRMMVTSHLGRLD
jgi:hypothetical protein